MVFSDLILVRQHEYDGALRTLLLATLLVPLQSLAAQTQVPPVIAALKDIAGPPQLLQESGAGEGPAWHPELGLLTSGRWRYSST